MGERCIDASAWAASLSCAMVLVSVAAGVCTCNFVPLSKQCAACMVLCINYFGFHV